MSAHPFFSIIIPTYNRAKLIHKSINSALNQSYQNFEILVIDNGSVDDTKSRIKAINDDRIRYFWQAGSGSPASPRNHGLRQAGGDWVAFLDSDDIWDEKKLEICKEHIDESNLDFLCHWQTVKDFSQQTLKTFRPYFPQNNVYQFLLLHENSLATSGTLIRRSFIIEHDLFFNETQEFSAVEDFDLWLRIVNLTNNCKAIPQYLGINYEHQQGLGSKELLYKNIKHLYSLHAFEIQNFSSKKDKIQAQCLSNLQMMKSMDSLRNIDLSLFIQKLYQAFKHNLLQPWRYLSFRICQRLGLIERFYQ